MQTILRLVDGSNGVGIPPNPTVDLMGLNYKTKVY